MNEEVLMDELSRQMSTPGSLADAISRMQQNGMENEQGKKLPDIDDMAEMLRDKMQHLAKDTESTPDRRKKREKIDRLEKQIQESKKGSLKSIDEPLFRKIMGDDAAGHLPGNGGLLTTRTQKYKPVDSFYIHPQKTIVNAVFRIRHHCPCPLSPKILKFSSGKVWKNPPRS